MDSEIKEKRGGEPVRIGDEIKKYLKEKFGIEIVPQRKGNPK